ncbi:FmdB family zinc ribbon protein [Symmachiella macrocystis]|uniref:FmdB family zinc ribbon protein n=1 Tax=Symmachiella macrocystis TaxID=2527985 RepID=UPI0011B393B7
MPIFEYACSACQHEFELLVRNGEQVKCPDCGAGKLEKLLSAPAAHATRTAGGLPISNACPPSDAPPCSPGCCRM